MNLIIDNNELSGSVSAISSKSHAHRALICAALAQGSSQVKCDNLSKDIEATANCLNGLGANIVYRDKCFFVEPINTSKSKSEIDCGESGSTLRFLLPIIGALGLKVNIRMHGRLPERPLFPLDREMEKHGCKLVRSGDILTVSGKLEPGTFEIEGNISSQFVSGLLFALPLIDGENNIVIKEKFESYSYVLLTISVLKDFGIEYTFDNNTFTLKNDEYKSTNCIVEGDWSNAAFWLCAGAMSKEGIEVSNLNLDSIQGDKKIINILRQFGAIVKIKDSSVFVKKDDLNEIEIDAADIPDLVPIVSLVACCAKGDTVIKNAGRLRIKESDRIKTVIELISNLGGIAEETDDGIIIKGKSLKGGIVNSYNDHRIVMTAAVASQICESEVEIVQAEAVNKSYPMFFEDLKSLKGNFKEEKV